jgi:hypothetical protein
LLIQSLEAGVLQELDRPDLRRAEGSWDSKSQSRQNSWQKSTQRHHAKAPGSVMTADFRGAKKINLVLLPTPK